MEESKISKVNIPISLKIKEINATINKLIDGVLYENGDLADGEDADVQIKAEKSQAISVSFNNDQVSYRVPLKIWIKKIIPITRLEVEAEGEIALSFTTQFKIEKDWDLITHTNVIDHEWLKTPHLRFGLFDLPIKFIVNTILSKCKTLLCTTIDMELAKSFDLQNYIKEAWKTLQAPVQVSEEFELWLSIFPVKVGMTPLVADEDFIKSTIMVQTYANALIGEKPKAAEEIPLPPFQMTVDIDDDFYLYLKTKITYVEAENIARKYVVGQTFSKGKRSINVVDVKLYGRNEKIVIETKLKGAYNGSTLLAGMPVFDHDKNEITIKNPEYELNTKNFLIRFFSWLFQRGIIKWLKKHLRFQLTENLYEVMNLVGNKLENFEITDNVFLNGNLSKLEVNNILMDEKGLMVTIISSGKISLRINKIAIQKESSI